MGCRCRVGGGASEVEGSRVPHTARSLCPPHSPSPVQPLEEAGRPLADPLQDVGGLLSASSSVAGVGAPCRARIPGPPVVMAFRTGLACASWTKSSCPLPRPTCPLHPKTPPRFRKACPRTRSPGHLPDMLSTCIPPIRLPATPPKNYTSNRDPWRAQSRFKTDQFSWWSDHRLVVEWALRL